jgi:hydrogenase/urease accessory protein HupE
MESGFTDALLRIAPLDGPIQVERLTPDRTTAVVATVPTNWQVAGTYLALGVEHILAGYDHLLLVVALVLLLQRIRLVIKAVTAFTVAHSITLAGVTLGLFGLPQAPVEALIALSILFLAVEIVKQVPGEPRASERTSWIVALLFGLLHGFGFAGALREIGLPEADLAVALLTFNLGVELGQLAIVAAVLALIALVRRARPRMLRPAVVVSSYAIGTLSAFWFIERLIT